MVSAKSRYAPHETRIDNAPAFSDESLALQFADLHADDLRYVAAWGKWLHWKDSHWEYEDTALAFDLARQICRESALACNERDSMRVALASARTVAAVERLAKSDRRLAATVDQWDSDPFALATPDGVVDLRTGGTRPARQIDYMTKLTAVAPGGRCPRWKEFLRRVANGDDELQSYLKRVVGYALTGDTSEHVLFFLYGTGANGKSVFLSAASGLLGAYHRIAPIETFVTTSADRHPTEIAGLRGARMVTAVETEEGRRWAESRIKTLTGGDRVAARFMRQDFFEFTPQFKLLIAGNHRPSLRSVDEAIRRRFHLIPFRVTIPPEQRDKTLGERLKEEWSGILNWAIEGCWEWQRYGIAPPAAVLDATKAYMEAEDGIAAWMDDCCELDPGAWTNSTALYNSWTAWAKRAGEFPGTIRTFIQSIENRGLELVRRNTGRGVAGIRIVHSAM